MAVPSSTDQTTDLYSKKAEFWESYLKGRPRAPERLLDRVFRYHEEHGGRWDCAHDIGAGVAPYASDLRSRFADVILSDISPDNVAVAQARLGTDGFSYRAARAEDVDDITPGTVDMTFASTMFHFCDDQHAAMAAMAKQLRPGGTFVCFFVGLASFDDPAVYDLYMDIVRTGNKGLCQNVRDPDNLLRAIDRIRGFYNVAPLEDELWLPGAQRISLNMGDTGTPRLTVPDMVLETEEPLYTGPSDVESFLTEDGWGFAMGINDIKQHIWTMTFSESDELTRLFNP
ncbi:uncharacterized protein E0L32_000265 [Thyridium curvatum]|uniref:Methyltransferase type 11 domain-containing protein n=1 Tax=Thyridium curvatum TaxID=1093900 RepID=A0A507BG24_9PEZI|nr:uncharacterized protein E0L32_000265 [Thyridium curvatum]TPX15931.1 hypothetical protein E0L32_000265 [Thyridium curvatum]